MRSLLFVPGDSPKKLEKAKASGADALILDLEDSISGDRKGEARATTLAFLKEFGPRARRPRLFVRVNGLATGLTDADLEVVAGRPDGIMLPKAEGGAAVVHLDAKLAAREALHGLPDGHVRIVALTPRRRRRCSWLGPTRRQARASSVSPGAPRICRRSSAPRPTVNPR